jgi:hypothetical protein
MCQWRPPSGWRRLDPMQHCTHPTMMVGWRSRMSAIRGGLRGWRPPRGVVSARASPWAALCSQVVASVRWRGVCVRGGMGRFGLGLGFSPPWSRLWSDCDICGGLNEKTSKPSTSGLLHVPLTNEKWR